MPLPGPISRTIPVERARMGGIRAEEPVRASCSSWGSVSGDAGR